MASWPAPGQENLEGKPGPSHLESRTGLCRPFQMTLPLGLTSHRNLADTHSFRCHLQSSPGRKSCILWRMRGAPLSRVLGPKVSARTNLPCQVPSALTCPEAPGPPGRGQMSPHSAGDGQVSTQRLQGHPGIRCGQVGSGGGRGGEVRSKMSSLHITRGSPVRLTAVQPPAFSGNKSSWGK